LIESLLQLFQKPSTEEPEADSAERLQVATCALLVEMAQSDDDFSDLERERIVQLLHERFGLSRERAEEVIALAQEELDGSVQLWRFTRLINRNFSNDEKEKVIEMVWRVIVADGKIDRYENHLVHRLAKLLNLTHRQLINAKIRVLHENSEP